MRNIFKSSIVSNSIIAAVDQAALSILNFIISIILIKSVTKVEYGYFSIGISILFFVASIQQAIVSTPLAVLLIEKKDQAKKKYIGSLYYGQFFIILPVVFIGFLTIWILSFWNFDSTQVKVAASVSFVAVGMLVREFLRAYLFADQVPTKVLKLDSAYIALLLAAIILSFIFIGISVATIFVLMGISASLVGFFFSRKYICRYNEIDIKESYSENWRYGKWALFGGLVTHMQQYSYLYLLGAMIGSAAVAEVSAARLFITPLILFRAGWGRIAIPHGSKLREEDKLKHFFKLVIIISILYVILAFFYASLIIFFSDLLQRYILSEKYINSFYYFKYWVVINVTGFAGLCASIGLQVTKNFELLSKINFITMLLTLASAYLLINAYGVLGGLTALIIGTSFAGVILWFYFFRAVFFSKSMQITIIPNKIMTSNIIEKHN